MANRVLLFNTVLLAGLCVLVGPPITWWLLDWALSSERPVTEAGAKRVLDRYVPPTLPGVGEIRFLRGTAREDGVWVSYRVDGDPSLISLKAALRQGLEQNWRSGAVDDPRESAPEWWDFTGIPDTEVWSFALRGGDDFISYVFAASRNELLIHAH